MNDGSGRILIIGAGSTGSSVAYNLAKISKREIVLLDKSGIGNGMTSYSTAVVRTHYSTEVVAKMAKESMDILANFSELGESGFVREGMLTISSDRLQDKLIENTEMLKSLGINETLYTPDQASELFPSINFEDVAFVAYEPNSGYADPVTTTNSYAQKAKGLGVKFLREEVTKVLVNGEKGTHAETASGKSLSFDKLIICTNVWTNHLLKKSGITKSDLLPLKISPHPVLIYKRPNTISGRYPIIGDLINRDYYKPEGNTLLSGGNLRSELDDVSVDPNTFDEFSNVVPSEYISEFSERIMTRIPDMKDATIQGAYQGMYDNTPDGHPIIDSLESIGLSNAFCCVGLSGHGFKLSPSLGRMTSELLMGIHNPDLGYFKLSRFRDGTSIFKKYEGIGTIS